jgi:hypothetical protein
MAMAEPSADYAPRSDLVFLLLLSTEEYSSTVLAA